MAEHLYFDSGDISRQYTNCTWEEPAHTIHWDDMRHPYYGAEGYVEAPDGVEVVEWWGHHDRDGDVIGHPNAMQWYTAEHYEDADTGFAGDGQKNPSISVTLINGGDAWNYSGTVPGGHPKYVRVVNPVYDDDSPVPGHCKVWFWAAGFGGRYV